MREIHKDSWHYWLFSNWWNFKNILLDGLSTASQRKTPATIGLCEYVRGIVFGTLILPVEIALGIVVALVFATIVSVMYVVSSAVMLVFRGTIADPSDFACGDPQPWEGRYQLALRTRWMTVYPWHVLVALGAAWILTRSPGARSGAADLMFIVTVVVAAAGTFFAIYLGSTKGWRRLRETDAWQLASGYVKAINEQFCPVLVVVDDQAPQSTDQPSQP